jgi:ParB-like chromosome segregation protein Spo0J
MSWRDKYKVHPAANVFPMMSDDELAALGEDIKANGLRIPIWFQAVEGQRDSKNGWVLIAGRNRLEAMERAGMATDYATLKDKVWKRVLPYYEDATAFIISENRHRRHLTKQEQAELYHCRDQGRGKTGSS